MLLFLFYLTSISNIFNLTEMATTCTINVVAGEYNFTLSPKYKKVKIFIHSEFEIDSLCITSPSKAGHCIQIQPGESYHDVIIKNTKNFFYLLTLFLLIFVSNRKCWTLGTVEVSLNYFFESLILWNCLYNFLTNLIF